MKIISFTISSITIKYWGLNQGDENSILKITNKLKNTQINRKMSHVPKLEELPLLKCPYYEKPFGIFFYRGPKKS